MEYHMHIITSNAHARWTGTTPRGEGLDVCNVSAKGRWTAEAVTSPCLLLMWVRRVLTTQDCQLPDDHPVMHGRGREASHYRWTLRCSFIRPTRMLEQDAWGEVDKMKEIEAIRRVATFTFRACLASETTLSENFRL